jgi:hypothetical protein
LIYWAHAVCFCTLVTTILDPSEFLRVSRFLRTSMILSLW